MRKHFILLLMTAVFLLLCFVSVGQVLKSNIKTEWPENFPPAYVDSTLTWNSLQSGVGVNRDKIYSEINFPEKPLEYFSDASKTALFNTTLVNGKDRLLLDGQISDNILKFPVHEFNPFIDSNNSIPKGNENTIIPGSEMGDLVSIFAFFENYRVFGCASCRSIRWPKTVKTGFNPVPDAFLEYVRDNVPSPNNHKIYFAYGTEMLDPNYKPTQQQVNKIMKIVGFTPVSWISKEFPGAYRPELAWSTRFYISLKILFGK